MAYASYPMAGAPTKTNLPGPYGASPYGQPGTIGTMPGGFGAAPGTFQYMPAGAPAYTTANAPTTYNLSTMPSMVPGMGAPAGASPYAQGPPTYGGPVKAAA